MQNPNFVFGKKKKAWFAKFFTFKNHILGMKLKASFSKCAFGKKHGKAMSYQTDPIKESRKPKWVKMVIFLFFSS